MFNDKGVAVLFRDEFNFITNDRSRYEFHVESKGLFPITDKFRTIVNKRLLQVPDLFICQSFSYIAIIVMRLYIEKYLNFHRSIS